jgi:hypothetical protein
LVIRKGGEDGEMLAPEEVDELLAKEFFVGDDIRRGQFDGVEFHGAPEEVPKVS